MDFLKSIQSNKQIMSVIAETMSVERFMEAALQVLKDPTIQACTPESIMGALLKAAIFGFRLSPELGECYIIPRNLKRKDAQGRDIVVNGKNIYDRVATFQIGYKGWQTLAFRAGTVESFDFQVVRQGDTFSYKKGLSPDLVFEECKSWANRGDITHVFATCTLKSGRVVFDVQHITEVERRRRMSDNQKGDTASGIWEKHYEKMAMRIPVKEICTRKIETSETLRNAIEADNGVTMIDTNGKVIEITPKAAGELAEAAEKEIDLRELQAQVDKCQTIEALSALYNTSSKHAEFGQLFTERKEAILDELQKAGKL